MLLSGDYVIVNKQTGEALDSNINAASQLSSGHPRAFMWQANSNAPNHQWRVDRQMNGNYIIKTRVGMAEYALDGNTNVPQHSQTHPAPFLYPASGHAPNHRWVLRPTGEYNTYLIINEQNGLALDGNVHYREVRHFDHTHKSPFLWKPVQSAANHHWRFEQVNFYYNQQNQIGSSGYNNMDGTVQIDCCNIL